MPAGQTGSRPTQIVVVINWRAGSVARALTSQTFQLDYNQRLVIKSPERGSASDGLEDRWDTIALLLAPDGRPVAGSDDANKYFAAFAWPAAETATYRLRVTFFEAVNSGQLLVKRK